MKHYTEAELELYRNGEMSLLGRMACARHLHECKVCTEKLQKLKEDDQFLKKLRDSVQLYEEFNEPKNQTKGSISK